MRYIYTSYLYMIGSQSLLDCEENERRRVPFYLVSLVIPESVFLLFSH